MATSRDSGVLVFAGIRGRSGRDALTAIPDGLCAEAVDVEFATAAGQRMAGMARKRNGVGAHGTTSFTSNPVYWVFRHVPGSDQTAAEMWAVDSTGVIKRLAAGTAWATVTPAPADTFVPSIQGVSSVSFNGKWFLACDSNIAGTPLNRLHVWDGTTLRRVGIAKPGTPTATEAAGAVTDVRKYKTSACVVSGGVVIRRSELSTASSAYTLTAENATVTFVGAPGEGETHWELWIGSDDDNYSTYRLSQRTAIATTTAVDAETDLTTLTTFAPSAGTNQLPPSCKCLATDGNRLLMAGAHETTASTDETTPKNNRVWFTPVLGTSDVGDDERVSHTSTFKGWVDVGENDGDTITGLGVLGGVVYVFKNDRLYRLRPTGDAIAPYLVEEVSKGIGAASHQSIFAAEDEHGAAALYFWSMKGPYRISAARGLEYVGYDVEDVSTQVSGANVGATFGLYYPTKYQVYFVVKHASGTGSSTLLVLNTRLHYGGRGGWSFFIGVSDVLLTSGTLFSETPAASMSRDFKPWFAGQTVAVPAAYLAKFDSGSYTGQARIETPIYAPTGFMREFTVKPPTVVAVVGSAVTIRCSLAADFHSLTGGDPSGDIVLTAGTGLASGAAAAAGTESNIIKRVDNVELAGMRAAQFRIGDSASVESAWRIDALYVPWFTEASL